jgi:hypothetical protein
LRPILAFARRRAVRWYLTPSLLVVLAMFVTMQVTVVQLH